MAKAIIQVVKNPNENNASVLRRFSRKVQELRMIQKLKKERYQQRKLSHFTKKKNALKKLARRAEIEKLKKLGKMK